MEELKKVITTFYKDLQHVPFPQGQGYCQFSGGGDICFVSNGKEATVITTVEEDIGCNVSPNNDFEEIEVWVIERKKTEGKSLETLISQLQANTIVACVNTFAN